MDSPAWDRIFSARKAAERLPHLLRLPTVASGMDVLLRVVTDGDEVLDCGANNRRVETALSEAGVKARYCSFDIDATRKHDYYTLDSIDRKFDVVAAFEIIEHMSVADISRLFAKAAESLREKGRIIVSTPNVCHPVVFWRDCTHITPVRYDELYGFLHAAGFVDINIYRSGRVSLKDRLVAFLYRPLLKLLRLDYMPGIVALARKP